MSHLLDPEILTFIQSSEVSLYLAGCAAQRQPRATRAYHCRPHVDGRRLVVWIAQHSSELLEGLNSNGHIALVVAHVQTCRSMQFKGVDAQVLPVDPVDYAAILKYQHEFIQKTRSIGHPEDVMRTHAQFRVDRLAAIHFTPSAAFTQTPGPKAGNKMSLSTPA